MSESKHTPGPWKVLNLADRVEIAQSRGQTLNLNVFSVEGAANAALIANAPELLRELKRLVAIVGELTDDVGLESQRAAIAKAEGRDDEHGACLTCEECGEEKAPELFCDPTASEPHCKECAAGFWEMMGDDPCGKGWRS